MGTIEAYETARGKRYRVRYRTPDHRQTDKRGFRTKREADLFLASVEVSKATGEYIDPSRARTTVAELGPIWLEAKQSRLKPSSYRALEDSWRVYVNPRWGKTAVAAITHSDVRTWVSQLAAGTAKTERRDNIRTRTQGARRKEATTVIRAYSVLASVLDIAVKDRRIPNNPARGVDNLPRKVRKAHRYLSHQDVERLATACGEHSTLVYVAAYTGLRWGELTALRVRDVDAVRRRLAVNENAVRVGADIHVGTPKTHERRSVPYPEFLDDPIAQLCEGKTRNQLLFGDGDDYFGRPRSSEYSRSWFKTALEEAGLERMTIHDLRHTAASLAISSGANVKAVQRMLGHASAAMTLDVYADLFDDDLDTVSASLSAARSAAIAG
ncbi:site-specific integrase [Microbacterium sp. CFH 90308]|uniref:Site-specific integrase n=1 Tax=Microbacterium salsuginis TaxID=2722803 RepID=A0ABX1KB39_9MICO|nr:site-specific integrase [Microbacterium sp. CFH 90308]NLP84169.1 site-specific integrase [Microbacterium sp. CFH 90308]